MRIDKAEGIITLREERRKLKNTRVKNKTRNITRNDFEEIEIREVERSLGAMWKLYIPASMP